jgi:hypothetical protein
MEREFDVKRLPKTAPVEMDPAEDGEEMVRDEDDVAPGSDQKTYVTVNTNHQISAEVPAQQRPGGFTPTIQTLKEHSAGRYAPKRK